jgi:PHS family inorganic phosphate transporter-like MFS transporter
VTTFTLPQETFPTEIRSTFNGFSAALAKVGAVIGIIVYGPIKDEFGLPATLIVCAVVSLAGAIVTQFFVITEDHVSVDLQASLLTPKERS